MAKTLPIRFLTHSLALQQGHDQVAAFLILVIQVEAVVDRGEIVVVSCNIVWQPG